MIGIIVGLVIGTIIGFKVRGIKGKSKDTEPYKPEKGDLT